jgi:hypothetical protein
MMGIASAKIESFVDIIKLTKERISVDAKLLHKRQYVRQ